MGCLQGGNLSENEQRVRNLGERDWRSSTAVLDPVGPLRWMVRIWTFTLNEIESHCTVASERMQYAYFWTVMSPISHSLPWKTGASYVFYSLCSWKRTPNSEVVFFSFIHAVFIKQQKYTYLSYDGVRTMLQHSGASIAMEKTTIDK